MGEGGAIFPLPTLASSLRERMVDMAKATNRARLKGIVRFLRQKLESLFGTYYDWPIALVLLVLLPIWGPCLIITITVFGIADTWQEAR
jgi:hypothetical protein